MASSIGLNLPSVPNVSNNVKSSTDQAPLSGNLGSVQLAVSTNFSVDQSKTDSFWYRVEIDGIRWNKNYPFQLLVVKQTDSGYKQEPGWSFTLPIGPESLQISMPFAIDVQATLTGIIEQHNGAPFKNITLSGTTGVVPLKGLPQQPPQPGLVRSIFAGTISTFNAATSSIFSESPASTNLLPSTNLDPNVLHSTGYYQFRRLQEFFENYAAIKKSSKGKNLRLAFAMWKDEATYLVTPLVFAVARTASSPFEYPYQLSFKAWKRIKIDGGTSVTDEFKPVAHDPNQLASLLTNINKLRGNLLAGRSILKAFSNDIAGSVFEVLRQTTLAIKDVLGVALSVLDLPTDIIQNLKPLVLDAVSTGSAISGFGDEAKRRIGVVQENAKDLARIANQSGRSETGAGAPGFNRLSVTNGINSGVDTSPADKLFSDPLANHETFDAIKPSQLKLTPEVFKAINAERARCRKFTRLDYEVMRNTIETAAADFADYAGAGDPTFNAIYGRPTSTSTRTPTQTDFKVIFNLNAAVLELNKLAASGKVNQFQVNSVEFIAGLANRSGIAFNIPRSKFQVPFPYGMTLERLAQQYLGDSNRWGEIAALNGLRPPYVDEEGFSLPLLVNGALNQVVIQDATNLYIGQTVYISSTSAFRTKRHITKIDVINPTQVILTLDGDPTLSDFITIASASLHAFLPNTVNSQMTLYMPSDSEPAFDDHETKAIPGLTQFDQLLDIGGVDVLLTQDNDLVVTPDGDNRLAVGLTNIVQRARLALTTKQGTLLRHPSYGLPIEAGMSTADLDVKDLFKSIQSVFANDPVFGQVRGISVTKNGNSCSIAANVGIAGTSIFLPISFAVN